MYEDENENDGWYDLVDKRALVIIVQHLTCDITHVHIKAAINKWHRSDILEERNEDRLIQSSISKGLYTIICDNTWWPENCQDFSSVGKVHNVVLTISKTN